MTETRQTDDFLFEPGRIARLEEARQAEGTAEMIQLGQRFDPERCADHAAEPIAGGWMTFAGKGAWANQASGLGLNGPVSNDELDRLVDFYISRGVEPKIEVASVADESLVTGLATRGFQLREFENVLARSLTASVEPVQGPGDTPPSGIAIEYVDRSNEEAVLELADVSTCGFRPEGSPISESLLVSVINMMRSDKVHGFVARDSTTGNAVGGSTMEVRGEASALFGTSVRSHYRRRGIQACLISQRVSFAREHRAQFVTIHSKPGIPTERNAARLGFRLVYGKAIMAMPGERLEPSP